MLEPTLVRRSQAARDLGNRIRDRPIVPHRLILDAIDEKANRLAGFKHHGHVMRLTVSHPLAAVRHHSFKRRCLRGKPSKQFARLGLLIPLAANT